VVHPVDEHEVVLQLRLIAGADLHGVRRRRWRAGRGSTYVCLFPRKGITRRSVRI
jgi:hypothetical protein